MLEFIGLLLAVITFYYSYKPLCYIEFTNYVNEISIKILNKGNAPMVIKSVNFKTNNFIKKYKKNAETYEYEEVINNFRALSNNSNDFYYIFKLEPKNKIDIKKFKEDIKQYFFDLNDDSTSNNSKYGIVEIIYTGILLHSILSTLNKLTLGTFNKSFSKIGNKYIVYINDWNIL